MSHILKRKIKNVIYIYQEKSYRDKLGRPRTKQKCLGKLDSDGILIISRKINPKNLPGSITEYKIITRKFRIKAITQENKPSQKINSSKPAKSVKIRKKNPPRPVMTTENKFQTINFLAQMSLNFYKFLYLKKLNFVLKFFYIVYCCFKA